MLGRAPSSTSPSLKSDTSLSSPSLDLSLRSTRDFTPRTGVPLVSLVFRETSEIAKLAVDSRRFAGARVYIITAIGSWKALSCYDSFHTGGHRQAMDVAPAMMKFAVCLFALWLSGCASLARHPIINPSTGTNVWPQATDLHNSMPNVPR